MCCETNADRLFAERDLLRLDHLEALEREAQMKVERDHFESEWATATKRVEELEDLVLGRIDPNNVGFDALIYREAKRIAERRAGRKG